MFKRLRALLWGLGLGATTMYLYDPDRGNRRRAMLRDQAVGMLNDLDDGINKGTRDLSNRASGMIAETRAMVTREQVSDDTLAQWVRSKIGGLIAHPRAIKVTAQDGMVTLSGPILQSDVQPLLARVRSVRGVRGVTDQLEVHDQPGDVPALQGEPVQDRSARMQGTWTPGVRLLAGLAGTFMALGGMRRGGVIGTIRTVFGLGLLGRSIANRGWQQLLGLSDDANAVTVRKGISVDAPVQEIFGFWQNFANFPRFMSNLYEVRDLGNGRSHWIAAGPAGTPVEWDAVITQSIPNQMIAWESEPGSQVKQAGMVRFAPGEGGTTHVNVQISYTPPAGILGHAVASFFGANPKQAMNEDLVRFKSLIERGVTGTDEGKVTRDEVTSSAGTSGAQAGQGTREQAHRQVIRNQPSGSRSQAGNRTDEVGPTGVYPASDIEEAPADAEPQGMASWGQGERGAAGYEDSGSSELTGLGEETDFGSVIPGPSGETGDEGEGTIE